MKKCTKCGIEKPLSEFYKRKDTKDGHRADCKECAKARVKKFSENPENKKKKAEYDARYRQENKEKKAEYYARYRQEKKEKLAEKAARYYQKNKERRCEYMARYHRERTSKQPACIYQIINEKNGKVYIGETLQGEIRWKGHLTKLRAGNHANSKLQEDYDKFGEEAFEWEILRELPKDRSITLLEEARTINKLIKENKDLYNLSLTIEQLKLLQENK